MVTEVISFPIPSAAALASIPVVHSAQTLGTRWNASPAPRSTAIQPNFWASGFPAPRFTMKRPASTTPVR